MADPASIPEHAALLAAAPTDGSFVLSVSGRWILPEVPVLSKAVEAFQVPDRPVLVDLAPMSAVDTAGAILINRLLDRIAAAGTPVAVACARRETRALLAATLAADNPPPLHPTPAHPLLAPFIHMIERIGIATFLAGREARALLNFFGALIVTLGRLAVRPGRFRLTAFVANLEATGLNALPILGLLSFLIGVVLAYQGADQLTQFGAGIYVVNLLGVSILREIGILMTAIIVAGRSGSAFTAQIGAMKVNQEIDAMATLGLDPMEVLVAPRVLALALTLPLVAFYADIVGLFGGAVMSYVVLGITPLQFVNQLQGAITPATLWVGLSKAPVFALVIAMVGCYQGMRVGGSAESVGRLTTRSVVQSIFLVIVLDAIFSIVFSYLGV